MASPSKKPAEFLEALHGLQSAGGRAIPAPDLTRTHRERLVASGFLREANKGWYLSTRPDDAPGGDEIRRAVVVGFPHG